MSTPKIPTPEAGDTPGDEIPSFSPSARESASKCRERTDACSGDTLTPGDKISSQTLAFAAVTADVTESPEGGAEPDRPVEEPWSHMPTRAPAAVSQDQAFPSFMRRYIDMPSASGPMMDQQRRASGAHLEPVGQRELDDDAKIPEFLRRQGVTSLATHAQPIASDREPSEGPQADQPSGFVPRELRGARAVTPPITQAPPMAAAVTAAVTAAPVAGSICPTCQCRVPARLTPAERQRAYRRRKREQGQGVAKGD
jgi:hypothetical protein